MFKDLGLNPIKNGKKTEVMNKFLRNILLASADSQNQIFALKIEENKKEGKNNEN